MNFAEMTKANVVMGVQLPPQPPTPHSSDGSCSNLMTTCAFIYNFFFSHRINLIYEQNKGNKFSAEILEQSMGA
jgi:hypothetical protein